VAALVPQGGWRKRAQLYPGSTKRHDMEREYTLQKRPMVATPEDGISGYSVG